MENSAIARFHRGVNEICALLKYYLAQTGNSIPTFRDKIPFYAV